MEKRGVAVDGISPDPQKQQKKFDEKHDLGFPLLCDTEHHIAEAYGVWGEKKMYGKTFIRIVRSSIKLKLTVFMPKTNGKEYEMKLDAKDKRAWFAMAIALLFTVWGACTGCSHQTPAPQGSTLYERLGGIDNIAPVIDDVIESS